MIFELCRKVSTIDRLLKHLTGGVGKCFSGSYVHITGDLVDMQVLTT